MDELLAEVRAARRADKTADQRHARVKELLIAVRIANRDLKVAELEQAIGKYYDRATISRVTASALKAADAAAES